jgi:hypothetical protein
MAQTVNCERRGLLMVVFLLSPVVIVTSRSSLVVVDLTRVYPCFNLAATSTSLDLDTA